MTSLFTEGLWELRSVFFHDTSITGCVQSLGGALVVIAGLAKLNLYELGPASREEIRSKKASSHPVEGIQLMSVGAIRL